MKEPLQFGEWLDLKALAVYASASNRTLRLWIHRLDNPLPAVQIGGKLRVRRSDFDRWMERQRVKPQDVGKIVDEILDDLTAKMHNPVSGKTDQSGKRADGEDGGSRRSGSGQANDPGPANGAGKESSPSERSETWA